MKKGGVRAGALLTGAVILAVSPAVSFGQVDPGKAVGDVGKNLPAVPQVPQVQAPQLPAPDAPVQQAPRQTASTPAPTGGPAAPAAGAPGGSGQDGGRAVASAASAGGSPNAANRDSSRRAAHATPERALGGRERGLNSVAASGADTGTATITAEPSDSDSRLPFTGLGLILLAGLGATSLLGGALLRATARRRRLA